MGIRVSSKHGVNPSVMQCFFCQEDVGVALLGQLPGDVEAPRAAVFDKQPCDKCRGHMEMGVILISVRADEPQSDNPYRTGGWVVLRDEAVERMVKPPELAETILNQRVAFVPDDAWDLIGLPRGEVKPEEPK